MGRGYRGGRGSMCTGLSGDALREATIRRVVCCTTESLLSLSLSIPLPLSSFCWSIEANERVGGARDAARPPLIHAHSNGRAKNKSNNWPQHHRHHLTSVCNSPFYYMLWANTILIYNNYWNWFTLPFLHLVVLYANSYVYKAGYVVEKEVTSIMCNCVRVIPWCCSLDSLGCIGCSVGVHSSLCLIEDVGRWTSSRQLTSAQV